MSELAILALLTGGISQFSSSIQTRVTCTHTRTQATSAKVVLSNPQPLAMQVNYT